MISTAHGSSWNITDPPMDTVELERLCAVVRSHEWNYFAPFVSPRMLDEELALSNDDHSDLLAWTFNVAVELRRDVFIDKEYYLTRPLEIQPGQRIFGRGMDKPGIKFRMDLVQQRMRRDLDNVGPTWAFDTRERQLLGQGPPCIIQANGCNRCVIEDLQIDGGQYLFNWSALQNSEQYNAAEVSRVFKDSPMGCGLAFSRQNGRNVDGLHATLRNVWIHDTCGSCLLGEPDIRVDLDSVRLGNAVGGRVLYGAPGEWGYVETYGFSRSSIARVMPGTHCHTYVTRPCPIDGPMAVQYKNPWNDNPAKPTYDTVLGIIDTGRDDNVTFGSVNIPPNEWKAALKVGCDADIRGRVNGWVGAHDRNVCKPKSRLRLDLTGDVSGMNFANGAPYQDFEMRVRN